MPVDDVEAAGREAGTLSGSQLLGLMPSRSAAQPLRVLCIGAHCDDVDIGCGATLLSLQREHPRVAIDWVLLSGNEERRAEARKAMTAFVRPKARGELRFGGFRDGFFPAQYAQIKEFFESLKQLPRPDIVFCHERDDRHQDHRIVNELVWCTFRDHLVLEYEIMKWDGGLNQPNIYVPVTAREASAKADKLLRAYQSQATKDWFTRDALYALLRLRGVECRAPSGFAEAFHGRKIVLTRR